MLDDARRLTSFRKARTQESNSPNSASSRRRLPSKSYVDSTASARLRSVVAIPSALRAWRSSGASIAPSWLVSNRRKASCTSALLKLSVRCEEATASSAPLEPTALRRFPPPPAAPPSPTSTGSDGLAAATSAFFFLRSATRSSCMRCSDAASSTALSFLALRFRSFHSLSPSAGFSQLGAPVASRRHSPPSP